MNAVKVLTGIAVPMVVVVVSVIPARSSAAVGDSLIATWKDNLSGAVSLTVDDALLDRTETLAILDDFGVKGTFYMDTDVMSAQGPEYLTAFQNASLHGHEIGAHTVSHPSLTALSDAQIHAELSDSQTYLQNLIGKPVLTMAYPFGSVNNRVANIARLYYIAARNVWPDALHPATGQDMHWLGEAPGPNNWTDAQFIQQRFNFAQQAEQTGGWAIEMYHNLADPGSANSELFHTEAALRGHLTNLTSGELSVWVAPVVDVAQYYLSREAANLISSFDSNTDEVTVQLTLSDPTDRITAPLTLLTSVPATWEASRIQIVQAGNALPFSHNDLDGFIQLNYTALPNAGDVLISYASPLPGDLNGDGFVGVDDLNIVLSNWNLNTPQANPQADPTRDGFVGVDDLNIVLSNWNAGVAPPSNNNVPEPGTAWIILTLVAPLAKRRL